MRKIPFISLIMSLAITLFIWNMRSHGDHSWGGDNLLKFALLGGIFLSFLSLGTAALSFIRLENWRRQITLHVNLFHSALAMLCLLPLFVYALGLHRFATRPRVSGNWSIGLYLSENENPDTFKPLSPQPILTAEHVTDYKSAFVADPILRSYNGLYYLFYEGLELATNDGIISVSTSQDAEHWTYGGVVLNEPFSISYPFVLEYQNQYYMVPESRLAREVRLYKATNFPTQWKLEKVLVSGREYQDSNILYYEGRWWLFTFTRPGDLYVFSAEDLLGTWTAHSQNPVVKNDPDHTKGGGSLFIHNDLIYRFAQDIMPYYGNQVWHMQIDTLTPEKFSQHQVGDAPILKGYANWNSFGMHTLSCIQREDKRWLAAVDGYGYLFDAKTMKPLEGFY